MPLFLGAAAHPGRLLERWRNQPADLRWFVGSLCLSAIAGSITDPAFNNYLRDTFDLSPAQRGQIEFPRELPGFLVAVTSGLLFFLPERRTAAVATLCMALGLAGLAWAGSNYTVMICFMVLQSAGMHLMMPMSSSIALGFAKRDSEATMLGNIGSITTIAGIAGLLVSWFVFSRYVRSWEIYRNIFIAGAVIMTLASIFLLRMRLPDTGVEQERLKFVVKKRYALYYILSIFHGARKQIFITFAPWVLITVFKQGPATFAMLGLVRAVFAIGFQPFVGRLIDRVGERVVIMSEGLTLIGVCMGYGYAHRFGTGGIVLFIVFACFVLDNLLFTLGMARTTYVSKIAERREDLTATLSLGITLDHVVSMSIPILGGITWMMFGIEYVFTGAAVLAAIAAVCASFVRIPEKPAGEALAEPILETERAPV